MRGAPEIDEGVIIITLELGIERNEAGELFSTACGEARWICR
jgi:hypothetical protein